jgi:hypothetical protein
MTEITIKAVRDAINVPEASELPNDAVQSGIDRAVPRVNKRLKGGEDPDLVWAAKVSAAAYLAALTYATRSHDIHPGSYDPATGRWTPVQGAEARSWSAVLNYLKDQMDEYFDELDPEEPVRHARQLMTFQW